MELFINFKLPTICQSNLKVIIYKYFFFIIIIILIIIIIIPLRNSWFILFFQRSNFFTFFIQNFLIKLRLRFRVKVKNEFLFNYYHLFSLIQALNLFLSQPITFIYLFSYFLFFLQFLKFFKYVFGFIIFF